MMWFRPCLKGTRAYFDRRWPPAQPEVCNYTGHKHGVPRPGERTEGLWERKTLRSLVQATEALAGRHSNCVTVGGWWLDLEYEEYPEKKRNTCTNALCRYDLAYANEPNQLSHQKLSEFNCTCYFPHIHTCQRATFSFNSNCTIASLCLPPPRGVNTSAIMQQGSAFNHLPGAEAPLGLKQLPL